jgi:hypothetical protein
LGIPFNRGRPRLPLGTDRLLPLFASAIGVPVDNLRISMPVSAAIAPVSPPLFV